MSGQAAAFLGLARKGRILDGMDADALLSTAFPRQEEPS